MKYICDIIGGIYNYSVIGKLNKGMIEEVYNERSL